MCSLRSTRFDYQPFPMKYIFSSSEFWLKRLIPDKACLFYSRRMVSHKLFLKYQINWSLLPWVRGSVMVINATFNNDIPVMSWRSVLLVEDSVLPGKNHRLVASHWQTLSHNVVSSTPRLNEIRTHNFSGDGHWLYRYL